MVGKRLFFCSIGIVATTVAIVGVFLPGIPTVFPLMIALWAFSKSSTYLRSRLLRVKLFKVAFAEIDRYENQRTVTREVKIVSQVAAWVSTLIVAILVRNLWITAGMVVLALCCSGFMLYVKTHESLQEEETVI